MSAELGPFANVLQSALQLSAGLKLTPAAVTLSADVVARTPQDAQAMVDVLKFAIQMVQNNQPQGRGGPSAPALADAARVTAAGSTMHLVLSVPERELERFFVAPGVSAPSSGQPKKIAAR